MGTRGMETIDGAEISDGPAPEAEIAPDAWIRIAAAADLEGRRPVMPISILGQRLVLFRDEDGQLGLIGRHCPHRGADLCFGRREDNGLRCPFHGWLFDRTGQCIEQPAEPADSTMHKTIKLPDYPVVERDGVVLAYFGTGEPPKADKVADTHPTA